MRRAYLVHSLIFIVSYAAFFFYLQGITLPKTEAYVEKISGVQAMIVSPSNGVAHRENTPSEWPATTKKINTGQAAAQKPIMNTVQPTTSDEVFVPDYYSPQAQQASLERAAQFDEHAGNRLAAVATLQQQMRSGDTSDNLMEALRAATIDEDAEVSRAARVAYSQALALKKAP